MEVEFEITVIKYYLLYQFYSTKVKFRNIFYLFKKLSLQQKKEMALSKITTNL
jgi:hypothetical protein